MWRLLLPGSILAFFFAFEGGKARGETLIYNATGTGRTTGHVVNLTIYNPTHEEYNVKIGPYLIPSADTTQGYVIPDEQTLIVASGSTQTVALQGYCTNPYLPPVREAGVLRPYKDWVNTYRSIDLRPEMDLALFRGFEPLPALGLDSLKLMFPGTDSYFGYIIDIDEFPQTSAAFVRKIVTHIDETYKKMYEENRINTPFNADEIKQREAVIQQSFWIAVCLMKGTPYGEEQLRYNLIKQYESLINTPYSQFSESTKRQLDRGISSFWTTFIKVGKEAGILRSIM